MLVLPEQRFGVLVRGACVFAEWRIERESVSKSRSADLATSFKPFLFFPLLCLRASSLSFGELSLVETSQKFPAGDVLSEPPQKTRNRIDAFERHRRIEPPLSALALRVSLQRRRSERG